MLDSRRGRTTDSGTRQALIDAAAVVIARDGVKAATTRRIAEAANLPLGTISYWFASKEELLEQVVESVLGRLQDAVSAIEIVEGSPTTDALTALRAAWQVVEQDDPGEQLALFELTALSIRTPSMRQLARNQYAMYRRAAAAGAESWLAQIKPDVPGGADAMTEMLAVLFDGMTLAWLADPEGANPDRVFTLVAWLFEQLN